MLDDKGPQKPLTDQQVEKIMSEDPAAMLFLEGMLPGAKQGSSRIDDELANLNDLSVADPGNATPKLESLGGKQ